MDGIDGNLKLTFQVDKGETLNYIGESVHEWQDVQTITGWLDLSSGESRYATYNAKVQESSHVFTGDYVALDSSIQAEKARAVVNGKVYDVMLIDDPMEMHLQLEIYLKYTGGQ